MYAEMEQVAHSLYEAVSREKTVSEIGSILFPGLRLLSASIQKDGPATRTDWNWYRAPASTRRQTLLFARFLVNDLLGISQQFYAANEEVFSKDIAWVYRNDLEGFKRAVCGFLSAVEEKVAEEQARSALREEAQGPNSNKAVSLSRKQLAEGRFVHLSVEDLNKFIQRLEKEA